MKVFGIQPFGTSKARGSALRAMVAGGLTQTHTLVMVPDYLEATARAQVLVEAGESAGVAGSLDDIAPPPAGGGFGEVEWRESWLRYMQEHGIAFMALPSAQETDAGQPLPAASIIRSYNRAMEALVQALRERMAARRRTERRREGRYACGRPPYGYAVRDGVLVHHPAQVRAVTFIFEQLGKGVGRSALLTRLRECFPDDGGSLRRRQFWDRVKIRRILGHAALYCHGRYRLGRDGHVLHDPALAFLPASWAQYAKPPLAAAAAS